MNEIQDNSAGLFVGVNVFQDPIVNAIPFAVNDAIELAAVFIFELKLILPSKAALAISGEPSGSVAKALLSELRDSGVKIYPATIFSIYSLIHEIGSMTGSEGAFIVSIATHGLTVETSAILAMSDLVRWRARETGISVASICDDVSKVPAGVKLLVVDACRARLTASRSSTDGESENTFATAEFLSAFKATKGMATLMGTTVGGNCYDDPERKHGAFSAILIDGLRGAATDSEILTLGDLMEYTDKELRLWIRRNRPDQVGKNLGLTANIEPISLRSLPLSLRVSSRTIASIMVENLTGTSANLDRNWIKLVASTTGAKEFEPSAFSQLESWQRRGGVDEFGPWCEIEFDGAVQRFRWMRPGEFVMGSSNWMSSIGSKWEGPPHSVIISKGFWIADSPCTQRLWRAVMSDNPSQFKSRDRPVESVSWFEAKEFIEKLQCVTGAIRLRFPAEAEWEFACRAGLELSEIVEQEKVVESSRIACFWDSSRLQSDDPIAKFGCPSNVFGPEVRPLRGTRSVRMLSCDRSGLFDMLGNVWEWCEDWAGPFPKHGNVQVDPHGPSSGVARVLRGCAWDTKLEDLRPSSRIWKDPSSCGCNVGFRLVIGAEN